MRNRVLALALAAMAAFSIGAASAQEASGDGRPSPRIVVTGEGRVAARPDMATITLGAQAEAETAKAAMDEVSASVAALMERLSAAGIAPRDIQTSGLTLNPVWTGYADSRAPEITGFAATNTVTVRVRELEGLGGVLDDVLEAGANSFGGLTFGLQEPRPLEDEARRAAVADARAQAGLLADAAGVTLGEVLLIVEEGEAGIPQPMFRMEASMASDAVPVASGEIDVVRRVRIEWAIDG